MSYKWNHAVFKQDSLGNRTSGMCMYYEELARVVTEAERLRNPASAVGKLAIYDS